MIDPSGKNQAGESAKNAPVLDCEQWEALLTDKMDAPDGMLAPEIEATFGEHGRTCPGCSELLEQAGQGRQWLKLLEAHVPAAPVDLLSRILAKTQGAGREADFAIGTGALAAAGGSAGLPGHAGRWGIPFLPPANAGLLAARGAHNARMVMTAGMAFFSVALTLSVAGVRLTSVHAAELRPQAMQANMSRSFYGTKKQVVSFYENLRLVYEVESKMHDMRHEGELPTPRETSPVPQSTPGSAPQTAPQTAPHPAPRTAPRASGPASGPGHAATSERGSKPRQTEPVLHGWAVSVQYVQGPRQGLFKRAASGSVTSSGSSATLGGATSKERNRV